MLTDQAIKTIVEENIAKSEKLGDQEGSESGHLAYISHELGEILPPKLVTVQGKTGWEITYTYSIIITTEFTYEPANPPYQYRYEKSIVVDDQGRLLSEGSKVLKWSNLDMSVDLESVDFGEDSED